MIESLSRLNISMDKFKTSEMGRALKKVFRNEIDVVDSVNLAKDEIKQYFDIRETPIEEDIDTGFFGDVIGDCPLCGRQIKRGKYSYGCTGYKEGCQFKINTYICGRAISVSNAKMMLQTGRSSKIRGFVSRKGSNFDACLKISEGKCVFDFDDNRMEGYQ